jgi:hypothetical protein
MAKQTKKTKTPQPFERTLPCVNERSKNSCAYDGQCNYKEIGSPILHRDPSGYYAVCVLTDETPCKHKVPRK